MFYVKLKLKILHQNFIKKIPLLYNQNNLRLKTNII